MYCNKCGVEIKDDCKFCPNCGAKIDTDPYTVKKSKFDSDYFADDTKRFVSSDVPDGEEVSPRSRAVAAILAFLLGAIGIHEFYLGKTFQGVLMLLFCWTAIPAIIGFVQFIMILCGTVHDSDGKLVIKW